MTIDAAVREWERGTRYMGCVSAADWFCRRVPGFRPERLTRFTEDGDLFQHVVCTNGRIRIDLSPYNDHPRKTT